MNIFNLMMTLGFFGVPLSVFMTLVCILRRRPVTLWILLMILCIVTFVIGLIGTPAA